MMQRHVDPRTPWPSIEEYALAHRCPTCRAPIGVECNAPRKLGSHASRQNKGIHHYGRDVRRAPWPEYRVPGQRYDSLEGGET